MASVPRRRLHDVRPQRDRARDPLRHRRGLVQQHEPEGPRMAHPDGPPVHNGGDAVRAARPRTLVPWKVRHLAALAPDLPRFRFGGGPGALPRHIGDGHASGHDRTVRDAGQSDLLAAARRRGNLASFFFLRLFLVDWFESDFFFLRLQFVGCLHVKKFLIFFIRF